MSDDTETYPFFAMKFNNQLTPSGPDRIDIRSNYLSSVHERNKVNDTIASDYFPITVPLRSVTFLIILFFVVAVLPIFTLLTTSFNTATAYPTIKDPNLKAEIVG